MSEGIRYPDALDGDDNLYHVNDALRLTLAKDYNPGDVRITVTGDSTVLDRWPDTGLLTLTEQCSRVDERALSFSYSGVDRSNGLITGLVLRPGFTDLWKPRRLTHVTCNVMAEHHNSLKDALIAVQTFVGEKGTTDLQPFGDTMEGRINFLRKIVLQPRAWFEADHHTGNVPLEVTFTNKSFRLGTDGTSESVLIEWDFGDNTASVVSTVSGTSVAPDVPNAYVIDTDGGTIKKTYYRPGLYDVRLTVTNDFGSDEITLPKLINARIPAPIEATMVFGDEPAPMIVSPGTLNTVDPLDHAYTAVPTIRAPINTLFEISVPTGENPATPGYSYAGEPLSGGGSPLDPVVNYTWSLGDDLSHPNAPTTKAAYTVGGVYDLKLRLDTQFGAFRITSYKASIDIVENNNLWMWLFTDQSQTAVRAYEYGLISETFKLRTNTAQSIARDASFLDNVPDSARQKQEFRRNTGWVTRGATTSGAGGSLWLYWASGRTEIQPASVEKINFIEYNPFTDVYSTPTTPYYSRPWNWASFGYQNSTFFCLGTVSGPSAPSQSPTNPTKVRFTGGTFGAVSTLTLADFENGAEELLQNPATFTDGVSDHGDYSVLRTAWKDNTGYIARNDSVGEFLRIRSFYRTEGTLANPFRTLRKLVDIQGPPKPEGELGDLAGGVYFFNNSGSISAYNPGAGVWATGGPGINSVAYRNLQDTGQPDYDSTANPLHVVTDHDRRAYMSFDYSRQVFLRFSEIDLTFVTLGARPGGDHFLMAIY